MGSAVSFLLAMFLLVILFSESSQALNSLTGRKRGRMGGLAKTSGAKRWDQETREFARTKEQLCDLAKRIDCSFLTR
ncbi:hypothetical protein P5673_025042 [Acropora cervicornis]|uniref:Uncharacterized protein n=1 Tax=Acropora cervicornis TaxID=6130 RepID=A0AAD9Q2W8_ACRCE|nr:hypothetical protein P5673_025042 [Acropora cervicornis]